jgi:hypothetical protein
MDTTSEEELWQSRLKDIELRASRVNEMEAATKARGSNETAQ